MEIFLPASICTVTLLQSVQWIWGKTIQHRRMLKELQSGLEGNLLWSVVPLPMHFSVAFVLLPNRLLLFSKGCCMTVWGEKMHHSLSVLPNLSCLQLRCCLQRKYLCQWLQTSGLQKTLLHKCSGSCRTEGETKANFACCEDIIFQVDL